ncbi:LOW QUALITY PROTEIN: hypothetical protein Dda_8501 [Drechslerella dactyloides]|uniref:BZIP domain-containing protein n=1 Tax=Drechslerella dactyloides TaxID=74499 RepID=A0AAD6ITD0_DREDA|nr:LOW QUALITY PROTEIN: hypothetical protein Dda_8501 [Drechslerella dactyloides]
MSITLNTSAWSYLRPSPRREAERESEANGAGRVIGPMPGKRRVTPPRKVLSDRSKPERLDPNDFFLPAPQAVSVQQMLISGWHDRSQAELQLIASPSRRQQPGQTTWLAGKLRLPANCKVPSTPTQRAPLRPGRISRICILGFMTHLLSPSSSSAGSPPSLAAVQQPQSQVARSTTVAIAPKAMATDDAAAQFSPTSTNGVTQRDWVIPPRPKKRKAQNRAAQRAFRERRAARLTELEEQIKHRDEAKETILMDQVSKITVENNVLRATVAELRRDIEALQRRDSHSHARHSSFSSTTSTAPSFASTFISQIASPAPSPRSEAVPCFEEAFGRKCCGGTACRNNTDTVSTLSPAPRPVDMEIDFTNMFSSSGNSRRSNNSGASNNNTHGDNSTAVSVPSSATSPSHLDALSTHPEESCGFCSEGTACVCAEMKVMERETELLRQQNLAREAVARLTPAAITPSTTSPAANSNSGGCTGEPGSCAQCQSDPMSTLFCRTLATKKPATSNTRRDGSKPGFVCCGGTACGKNPNANPKTNDIRDTEQQPPEAEPEALRGTYIPCSDAYLSLSRHRRFMEADLGTVVRKLNTSGLGVEVSSVKQVLEYLEALESFQNNNGSSTTRKDGGDNIADGSAL